MDIMGWESSNVVRFDHGPLLQGQMMVPGFGELSFWWIQICISCLMCGSSSVID